MQVDESQTGPISSLRTAFTDKNSERPDFLWLSASLCSETEIHYGLRMVFFNFNLSFSEVVQAAFSKLLHAMFRYRQ